jgi:hypothetical protein
LAVLAVVLLSVTVMVAEPAVAVTGRLIVTRSGPVSTETVALLVSDEIAVYGGVPPEIVDVAVGLAVVTVTLEGVTSNALTFTAMVAGLLLALSVTVIVTEPEVAVDGRVTVSVLPDTLTVALVVSDEIAAYGAAPPDKVNVAVGLAGLMVALDGVAAIWEVGQLAPAELVTVRVPIPPALVKLILTVPGVGAAGEGFKARVTVTLDGSVPLVGATPMPGDPPGVAIEAVNVPVPLKVTVPD